MDAQPAAFGEKLRLLRRQGGLSLREFEERTHHSKTLVWEWEKGHKVPDSDVVDRLDHLLSANGALIAAAAVSRPVSAHIPSEIVRHYAHQGPVAAEIRRRARDATQVDVLAVRGLGIIGLNDSLLRPILLSRTSPLSMRIMLLDPDCDASARRAAEIGESPASFSAGINLALTRLEEVAAGRLNIVLQVALYTQLPVWRIIRVDDIAWISTFGETWEGHESTIYEIPYTLKGSFWAGYRRQFEDMYAHARRVI